MMLLGHCQFATSRFDNRVTEPFKLFYNDISQFAYCSVREA